ncbi:MAG: NodT family efflux system outer rane lipoprotein [Proteobacteria bacterium]|nr:NodT family efflux system outer rane lipoprotein [Pseudomonadota bacterium]
MNKSCLLVVCAALAGCSLMPEYLRPAPPVATSWPKSAPDDGKREAAALEWRNYFSDARLQGLIAAALEHNRDLRIAAARIEEARALYGITKADRLPTLNATAAGASAHVPADLSMSGREATSRRYDVGVSLLSFELDFWGRVRSLNEAARSSYLASEEAGRYLRLSLISDVANAYFALLEMEERVQVARETLRSREETRNMISKRREVGLSGDLDYLQADGAYQLVRADLANLERQRAAAENALVLLVGTTPANLPADRSLAEQGIVADLAAGLPSEILQKRPDVLAAENRLMAANANIGAARAAFLPRISLTGMFGTASKALGGLFESGSGAWSFQPVLSLPIFDAGRVGSGLDLAKARKVIAVAEYEKTIQVAFREVADLLEARTQLASQLEAQQSAEKSQTQALSLAQARYRGGISSYLEVLDAERNLFASRQATVQIRRAQLSVSAQLYKALGGGLM